MSRLKLSIKSLTVSIGSHNRHHHSNSDLCRVHGNSEAFSHYLKLKYHCSSVEPNETQNIRDEHSISLTEINNTALAFDRDISSASMSSNKSEYSNTVTTAIKADDKFKANCQKPRITSNAVNTLPLLESYGSFQTAETHTRECIVLYISTSHEF